jgi:methionine-rich copper-binding protein CopC
MTIANTTVGKGLSIHSRSDGHTVVLTAVEVQKNTRIVTGRGADAITVDDSIFHGSFGAHTGRGADSVLIESQGDPAGAASNFDGPVEISLGSGDDVLQLGITGNAGNHSVFAKNVRFNGGQGSDTLSNANAATYLEPSRVRMGGFEFTNAGPDTIPPTVTSTNPADGAVGVQPNVAITSSFSEALAPATVTAASVTLTDPGQAAVAGTVSYAGTTVTFTPSNPLADNTVYTLTIGTAVTDTSGNALASSFVSTFTTGAAGDTTAPTVTATNPADGQINVAVNSTAAVTFSEPMDPQTITSATFTLTGPGGAPVAGTVNYSAFSNYAAFTPSSDLAAGITYTATIVGGANGVTDLAGNPLAVNKVWTFTT